MSHISIVINAQTPGSQQSVAANAYVQPPYVQPPCAVTVSYVPADTLTPAQIGAEITRIQRHVNQIIGVPD